METASIGWLDSDSNSWGMCIGDGRSRHALNRSASRANRAVAAMRPESKVKRI